MSYTPGPWTLEEPEYGGRVMAGAFIVHEPPGSPHHHELRADARLFAAAPDLLAACERMLDGLDDYWVTLPEGQVALGLARGAVKKARGET